MKRNAAAVKPLITVTASLMLVMTAGCAQMPTNQAATSANTVSPTAQKSTAGRCNPALIGAVGALAGAFLGQGKGHLVGAAVGAGLGALACMAYNYHTSKVRAASSVEADYVRQQGALPAMNTVSSYASSLQPSNAVQAGAPVAMTSHIVVVNGTHDSPPQLAETLTLFSPDGKELSTVTKPAADINGSGEYQTDFNFNLPKGIQDGRYKVRSILTLNGKQVGSNEMPMVVVA